MTRDEFTEIAWRDFVLFAWAEPEMRDAFTKVTGMKMSAPRNPLEAAIDEATGFNEHLAAAFVDWVTINYWGAEDAPAKWRASHTIPSIRSGDDVTETKR